MYTSFFGLNEKPFSITPDPRYLFMSERHGEALAHLVYGVTESGGFIQLTGEVGTGKTTLCRTLLLSRMPANADVAVVLNPQLSALEFLEAICEEVDLPLPEPRGSIKALIDTLNRHLLDAHSEGRRTILVVDEAQNLAPDVLEQVRLLTNLETAKQKLLQIILIGQPELRELLGRNDLRQLAQRITGRYHLEPLSRDETDQYIEHRLKVAGALGEIFDKGAKREVFRLSQGVPRLINVICDRALLGAYSRGERRVDRRLLRRAAAEVTGEPELERSFRWAWPLATGAAVVALVAATWWFLDDLQGPGPEAPVAVAAAEPSRPAIAIPVQEPVQEAVAPAADADPAPPMTLEEQLGLAVDLTTEAAAMTSLFRVWGLDFDPASPAGCAQAESAGLSCLRARGSFNGLRQLNRPAILTLIDAVGDSHFVLLEAIEGNQARLSVGGVEVMQPIVEVSALWFGQYQLLWRPANGESAPLRPGSRSPTVGWLRRSLAEIDPAYAAPPLDSDVYDNALAGRVREFQRDNRLDVDGIAGHQTQIIINTLLAPDGTPRLVTPRLARE
jgi:general secretion pathway protein A